ncbi:hypothetical protein HID58_088647, partial [Brassica napus]
MVSKEANVIAMNLNKKSEALSVLVYIVKQMFAVPYSKAQEVHVFCNSCEHVCHAYRKRRWGVTNPSEMLIQVSRLNGLNVGVHIEHVHELDHYLSLRVEVTDAAMESLEKMREGTSPALRMPGGPPVVVPAPKRSLGC